MAADIAGAHHEHWNGKCYPAKLKGEAIPLVARIAAVADVFDALTSKRLYKPAWTPEKAFEFLHEQSGAMFDPCIVDVFESCREEVLAYLAEAHDAPEMSFARSKLKRPALRRREAA